MKALQKAVSKILFFGERSRWLTAELTRIDMDLKSNFPESKTLRDVRSVLLNHRWNNATRADLYACVLVYTFDMLCAEYINRCRDCSGIIGVQRAKACFICSPFRKFDYKKEQPKGGGRE